MIHKAQIELFLLELRKAIAERRFAVIPREKNNAFLASCGMTPAEREKVVAGLTSRDYASGPEYDRDHPEELDIWKFRKRYCGKEIYIKLKLVAKESGYYAKCFSFHD
jgi:hypothetical protein